MGSIRTTRNVTFSIAIDIPSLSQDSIYLILPAGVSKWAFTRKPFFLMP